VDWWRSFFRQESTHSRLIGVARSDGLTLFVTIFSPRSPNGDLAGGAAIAIVILGLSWLIGWSGQISLGNSASWPWAPTRRASGRTTTRRLPSSSRWCWPWSPAGSAGLIIAIPSTRLRGPYLAGLTLAFAAAVTPIAQNFTSVTGGEGGSS
jgi:branched-chain amino acid transport system ATP-binding protein